MTIEGTVLTILCVVFFGGIGSLCVAEQNENIRKRECRVELVTQTKLDTANILLICQGAK